MNLIFTKDWAARQPNEAYDSYKLRRKRTQRALKNRLRGRIVQYVPGMKLGKQLRKSNSNQ